MAEQTPIPAEALDLDALMELATPLLREAFDEMPPEQAAVTALGRRIRGEVERIYAAGLAAGRTAAEVECDQLASILAEIGDSISPTGERPVEALGTLAADVRALAERADGEYERGRTAAAEGALMAARDDLHGVADRLRAKAKQTGDKTHVGTAAGVDLACFRLVELADRAARVAENGADR